MSHTCGAQQTYLASSSLADSAEMTVSVPAEQAHQAYCFSVPFPVVLLVSLLDSTALEIDTSSHSAQSSEHHETPPKERTGKCKCYQLI